MNIFDMFSERSSGGKIFPTLLAQMRPLLFVNTFDVNFQRHFLTKKLATELAFEPANVLVNSIHVLLRVVFTAQDLSTKVALDRRTLLVNPLPMVCQFTRSFEFFVTLGRTSTKALFVLEPENTNLREVSS